MERAGVWQRGRRLCEPWGFGEQWGWLMILGLCLAAEMVVGPVKTLFMDEISTGLDASTTFQIVKAVRNFVHYRKVRGVARGVPTCAATVSSHTTPLDMSARVIQRNSVCSLSLLTVGTTCNLLWDDAWTTAMSCIHVRPLGPVPALS